MNYWIAVASAQHVAIGREGGFMQVCHGKSAPLKRIRPGDKVIYYSPSVKMGDKSRLQAFTAIGEVVPGEPYQVEMARDFHPFRRDVEWYAARQVPIQPLLQKLEFTAGKRNWGYPFRFGVFKIDEQDFAVIADAMQEPGQYIARALKEQRKARGWSLDQTARETGVSKAMLGQIERGESSPTIATLWKIATGFNIALSEFTDPPDANAGAQVRQADQLRRQPAPDQMLVASLFPYDPAFGFELFELTLLPGYVRHSEPHAPGVTEHVTVIKGEMEVLIEGKWRSMQEGDAVRFAADRAHGYRNLGTQPAVFHNLIHYRHDRDNSR